MKTSFFTFIVCTMLNQPAKAQSPKPTINHIAQTVVNMQESEFFYGTILGLDTIPEPFHDGLHTWYAIGGNASLHIIGGAKQKIARDKGHHLCFSVVSMDHQIAVLKKYSLKWEDWPGKTYGITTRPDGVKQIWLQDPDGYWIEINDAH